MKLKLSLLILNLALLACGLAEAQVRIGVNEPTESFAALQIDGVNQGLRLSQLTNSERDKLNVNGVAAAKGLVIYNRSTETIEFYNGTRWVPLTNSRAFSNGIYQDNSSGEVKLGGNLTEATTIAQGTNTMNFVTGANTFSVNTDVLAINQNSTTANADNFTVKNGTTDVFKVNKTATGNTITANVGASGLDVNNGALNISGSKTTVDGVFTYKDGTEGAGKVLTSNAGGTAYWSTLKPSTTYKTFPLSVTEGTPSSTGTNLYSSYSAITNTITLEAGKWIVTGMLYTYTPQATNAGYRYLIIMRLYDTTNRKDLYVAGNLPESKGSASNYYGGSFSAIPMTCFLEVPAGETWTVRIDATTERSGTYLIRDYNWLNPGKGSEFKAMRVND